MTSKISLKNTRKQLLHKVDELLKNEPSIKIVSDTTREYDVTKGNCNQVIADMVYEI